MSGLSPRTVDSFLALAELAAERTLETFERRVIERGLNIRAHPFDDLSDLAVWNFERGAEQVYAALLAAHSAEPPVQDANERTDALGLLLQRGLLRLQQLLDASLQKKIDRANAMLGTSIHVAGIATAHRRACAEYGAKPQMAVAELAHVRPLQPSSAPQIHVAGSVGVLQAGSHSTTNVGQQSLGQADAEVIATIAALVAALRAEPSLDPRERAEVVEVLEQVQAEARKDTPNRQSVSGLLTSASAVIRAIPAVEPAWQKIVEWAHAIGAAVGS